MRKSILAVSALSMLTIAACKSENGDKYAQKWQVVIDHQAVDSAFEEQLKSFDTLTTFPPQFLEMKEQMKKMSPEELAKIPPQSVEMLKIDNFDTFKLKLKQSMLEEKKAQDEMEQNRAVVFDFMKSGIIKNYATDNVAMVDTSTGWKADEKNKSILLFANPSVAKGNTGDTMRFKVLHISADSMSLLQDAKDAMPGPNKPMNFKKYVEPKK